ncbi:hypothetical protein [Nocardia sp. NBC_00511]|uniref:hypothetical protein n=1 Tax=Nocardia sp. NBC_00511 TaxID=2903591 RepID=UPI0030E0581E
MPKFTVRRTVTVGLLGAAAVAALAVPAAANAATPDSLASVANSGSAGSSAPAQQGPDITVFRNPDGTVSVAPAQPGRPGEWQQAIPATPLQPGMPLPDGVTVIQGGPGSPSDTITVSPVR